MAHLNPDIPIMSIDVNSQNTSIERNNQNG